MLTESRRAVDRHLQGVRLCSASGETSPHGQGRPTHRRVRHAAGEGYAAFLAAVAGPTAVEVDVEVPVFRAICPTALVLQSQKPRTMYGS